MYSIHFKFIQSELLGFLKVMRYDNLKLCCMVLVISEVISER